MTAMLRISAGPYPNLFSKGLSLPELQQLLKHLSHPLHPSFIQKKLLTVISQLIFRKLDGHNKGGINRDALRPYLTRLLHIFTGTPSLRAADISTLATNNFYTLSEGKGWVSHERIAQIILPHIPKTLPQRIFIARLCTHGIFFMMGIDHKRTISQQEWSAFALYLHQSHNL